MVHCSIYLCSTDGFSCVSRRDRNLGCGEDALTRYVPAGAGSQFLSRFFFFFFSRLERRFIKVLVMITRGGWLTGS